MGVALVTHCSGAPPRPSTTPALLRLHQQAMLHHTNHTAGMPPASLLQCCCSAALHTLRHNLCVLSSLSVTAALLPEDGVDVAVVNQHVQVQLLHRVLQAATTASYSYSSSASWARAAAAGCCCCGSSWVLKCIPL